MSLVQTVNGSLESSELGVTYMHEHVFVLTADVQQNFPEEWGDEDARVADAVAKLTALADQGVRTIVDPTVIGLGRYVPRIQAVAAQVPQLNIVVATGCYTYDDLPFFFHHRPADVMADMFVRDISEGIGGTTVRAGMLKCAIDRPGLTPGVERVMRSVARAHHATGTPITVHTHPGRRTGLEVHRVLCEEEGVDPRCVVLGHSGDSTDTDHLSALADLGFVLGMDRFGIYAVRTFAQRVEVVVELCRRGYAEQLVLSQDAACYIDWLSAEVLAGLPDWHYLHLRDDVIPALREAGVSEAQVTQMLVDAPRSFFEHVG